MGDENSLREDISYLRQMAESGRKGPIMGGIFLAGAGAVFGGACFVDAARQHGLLPQSLTSLQIWLGAAAVFAVFWVAMFLRLMKHGKPVAAAPNAVFGTIWSASGIGVMVCFLTTLLIARELHSDVVLAGYVPVIFAFYGTAWFASAALARKAWMHVAGAGSFAYAFAVALLIDSPWITLAMGAGLLLLLTLPGLKLVADEARS
jgi:hypothetical protein